MVGAEGSVTWQWGEATQEELGELWGALAGPVPKPELLGWTSPLGLHLLPGL